MLKPGDILFFNKGNPNNKWYHKIFTCLQRTLDEGVIHVEIVADGTNKDYVLTLGSNADGTKYRRQLWNHKNVAVKRHKYVNNYKEFQDTILETYHNMDDKKYDYKGLANATINQLFEKFTRGYWRKKNILRNTENTYCSEFIINCYKNFGVILNRKGEDSLDNHCTPGDLYTAYDFEFVKPFGKKIGG